MHMRTLRAVPAPYLAAHHDGGSPGSGAHPEPDGARDNGSAPTVRSVDANGRSPEAVRAALAAVPGDLTRLVNNKSDDDLMRPAQDGGWGLVEILPHLRDWERILGERVRRVLEEDAPSFEDHDDSLWAIEHGYRDQDPREALREFVDLRTALVERLESLTPGEWQRVAVLPRQGRVTLHWMLDRFCDHDTKHVVQARDVLA
jgi:hypothetical protein